jgi:CRISPR/Cas system CMR-associated protein Cmr3 (group 5 of RAMP superfamily)
MQVGITKSTGGDENEKGFYKQEVIRFKESDTSFSFYLDLDDGVILGDDIVFIGAQRSCFKMSVQPLNKSLFIPEHPAGSILICSPTYVKDMNALNENCIQHWSRTISFRNIRMDNKGNLKSGAISYSRHGSLCTFLAAGSVIFYDSTEQKNNIVTLLNIDNLKNIGYNHYSVK